MITVMKYGGSSVATVDQIKKIAQHIKEIKNNGRKIVVVASAMGKTTNNLISLASELATHPNKRELDALLSTGETQTVSLLAIALWNLGVPAISFMGFQAGFITTDTHSRAFIKKLTINRIKKELINNKVVVVAGFQGITENEDITTLGRGGSDLTAVAIAAKLKCPCEIYTDVEGVYTIDPRLYDKAKKIPQISHEEMMEMAVCGAKVLDARCVEIAKKFNVKLFLGKTLENDKSKGTYIMKKTKGYFESMPIKSITAKDNVSVMAIKTSNIKTVAKIFEIIAENPINLEMVNHNIFESQHIFSFVVLQSQIDQIYEHLQNCLAYTDAEISASIDLTKISLVGMGLCTHTGIAKTLFKTLIKNNIPFEHISVSEISISFLISENQKKQAINVLAKEFNL